MTSARAGRGAGMAVLVGMCLTVSAAWSADDAGTSRVIWGWDDCARLALAHNTNILRAAEQIEFAEGARLEFRSRALPQIEATALTFPPLVFIEARQAVFDQRTILAWKASNLAGTAARLNYELEVNESLTEVRVAYLNVITLQELRTMTRAVQSFLERRRDSAQARFDSGQMQKAELEQIEVRLALLREVLLRTENQLDRAKIDLLKLVGTGDRLDEVTGSLENFPSSPVDRSRVVQLALTRLPELRLLERLAEGSDFQARIARAERYPNVYLFGRAEFSPGLDDILGNKKRTQSTTNTAVGAAGSLVGGGTEGSGSTVDATTDTTGINDVGSLQARQNDDDEFEKSRMLFGVQLSWLVFDGGKSEGKARRWEGDSARNRTTAEQLRLAIPGQVDEAWQRVESAREMLETSKGTLPFEELLAMAEDEYRGDRASHNETLSFALDGFGVHGRLLRARLEANVGLTILRRMSGQLLAFAEDSVRQTSASQ